MSSFTQIFSYDFMINSDFGLIWYDKTRNEVDIYDPNSDFKIRELLFLASDRNNCFNFAV